MVNGIDSYSQTAQYAQVSATRPDPKQPAQDRGDDAVTRTQPQSAPVDTSKGPAERQADTRKIQPPSANDSPLGPKDGAQKRGSLLDITV